LLLVAKKIDTTNTAMMTGTTKNGEEMCMVGKLLAASRIPAVSFQLSAFSLQRLLPSLFTINLPVLRSSLLTSTTWLRAES
jgi:hypothetical protein